MTLRHAVLGAEILATFTRKEYKAQFLVTARAAIPALRGSR